MVYGFQTLKKPILRDAGMPMSAFTKPERFSWERKKILSVKQKSTSKILNKWCGE
jgi:hypothetical protein